MHPSLKLVIFYQPFLQGLDIRTLEREEREITMGDSPNVGREISLAHTLHYTSLHFIKQGMDMIPCQVAEAKRPMLEPAYHMTSSSCMQ